MSRADSFESHLSVGEVIDGCYEVRRLLGRGGMGEVYEARDLELNRLVAIKVNHPSVDGEQLRHEARLMAAFQHPGLPIVFAMGKHQGLRYVIMERLFGRSLADHIREGGIFGARETRDVLLAVAESLVVLHDANVAHRDLKPDNVMLVPPRRVVVVDFGISGLEAFAAEGEASGSLHYIAPEVATGAVRVGEVRRTDVYALGVIGFQMLTGRTPYLGFNAAALISQVIDNDAPPVAALRSGVYPPLAELIAQMLARDPANRPDSSKTVAMQLRAMHIAGEAEQPRIGHKRPEEPPTGVADVPIRVLVADDEPAVWKLLSYVLEDRGYDITFVEDGARALAEFDACPFEIVVTDKNMPRMNGLELLREIKRRRPSTDVVLITGYPSREAAERARRDGAYAVIDKPFDIDELAGLVAKLAERQRALRISAATLST